VQSFKVTGMTCSHCVRAVADAVRGVDAAAKVEVDFDTGRVTVREETATPAQIAAAIAAEGYAAEPAAAA
jgi:copper chaperone